MGRVWLCPSNQPVRPWRGSSPSLISPTKCGERYTSMPFHLQKWLQQHRGSLRSLDKSRAFSNSGMETTLPSISRMHPSLTASLESNLRFRPNHQFLHCLSKGIDPMSTLPELRLCSIRLSQHTNHTLTMLAEAAVRRLTGTAAKLYLSPRNQLPAEILLQILRYTDLIAPHALTWKAGTGIVV